LIGLNKRVTEAQLINALAWSVFAGGVLQLSLLVYALRRINMSPRFVWAPAASGVKRLLTLMVPAVLGVSVSQISLMINTQYATHIGEGAVSWLASADRLMEFPSALLGVALGAVILPSLVRHKVAGNHDGFSKLVDWGLRLTIALAAPATLALAALSVPVIATIFWHGKFARVDVMQTQAALLGYCVGLIGIIAVKILAPSFYAKQDIKTPLKVGIVILILTQIGNFVLVPHLKHAALSLTISIGALLNAGILYVLLRRAGLYKPEPGWLMFLLKVGVACGAMVVVLLWLAGDTAGWFQLNMWQRMGRLSVVIAAGASTYFAVLWITGIRPRDFKQIGGA
jgi:putative peptidoglycan lipid II flippase